MNAEISPLVDCAWLAQRLNHPEVVILDATFFMPQQGRDAAREFLERHIPSARFFDIDAVADHSTPLPHMLPSPDQFEAAVSAMGIDGNTHVIAYDNNCFMASARLWWTFRVFGHTRVSVLDGGLSRWLAEQQPLSKHLPTPAPRSFKAIFNPELVADHATVLAMMHQPNALIVDARSRGRFVGTEPEPRQGLHSGHIPGSHNVFFKQLIDDANGCLKSMEALTEIFGAVGITSENTDEGARRTGVSPSTYLVTTCGTGVTAAILALGLFRLGRTGVAVYDGSWTEWGGRDDTPIVSGEA